MSIVWLSIFILLCIELIILFVLVIPMPKSMRRFVAKTILSFNLAPKIRFFVNFITLGLILAVWDAVQQLQHLEDKAKGNSDGANSDNLGATRYITTSYDRQRKFRAERNLYLAGFTLVSLFVIARIVELLQETVDLEEQRDALKKALSDRSISAPAYTSIDNETSHTRSGLRRRTSTATSET